MLTDTFCYGSLRPQRQEENLPRLSNGYELEDQLAGRT